MQASICISFFFFFFFLTDFPFSGFLSFFCFVLFLFVCFVLEMRAILLLLFVSICCMYLHLFLIAVSNHCEICQTFCH